MEADEGSAASEQPSSSSSAAESEHGRRDDDWVPSREDASEESEQAAPSAGRQEEQEAQPEASAPAAPPAEPDLLEKVKELFKQRGVTYQTPRFNRAALDVPKLWSLVSQHGGYDEVCKRKLWANVGRSFGPIPKSMTNLSFHIKKLYERTLLAYEREQQGVFIDIPTSPRRPRKAKAAAPIDAAAGAAATAAGGVALGASGGDAAAASAAAGGTAGDMEGAGGGAAGQAAPKPKPPRRRRRAAPAAAQRPKLKAAEQPEDTPDDPEGKDGTAAAEGQKAAGSKRKAADDAEEGEAAGEASQPRTETSQQRRTARRRAWVAPSVQQTEQQQEEEQQEQRQPPQQQEQAQEAQQGLQQQQQQEEVDEQQQQQHEQQGEGQQGLEQQGPQPSAAPAVHDELFASELLDSEEDDRGEAAADVAMADDAGGAPGLAEATAAVEVAAAAAAGRGALPVGDGSRAPNPLSPIASAAPPPAAAAAAAGGGFRHPAAPAGGLTFARPLSVLLAGGATATPAVAPQLPAANAAAIPQQAQRPQLPTRQQGKRHSAQGAAVPRPRSQRLRARAARSTLEGSDELLEQLAAEQLAALATAAFEVPAVANHSGGSATAGLAPGAQPNECLDATFAVGPSQSQPGQLEQPPHLQLEAFRAALAVAAADRQNDASRAAGEGGAAEGAAPAAGGGPSWAAEAAAGASLGLSRIDLPTSVMLMQQAAGVIRGLHEELQRSKTRVFELTAELAAASRTAEAAQEEARQARAAGQQAHATLQQLLLNGAPQLVQSPQMVLVGPGLFGQARPAQAQQAQHVQQQAAQPYASPLFVQQVPPRLQLPAQHRPSGAPSQSPSPRFAQPQPQLQPPSPHATQLLPSQSPPPRFAAPQLRQPASPRSAQPLLLTPQSGPPRLPAGLQLTPSQLQQLQQASARQPPTLPPPVWVPPPRAAAPPGQPAASPPLSPRSGRAAGTPPAFAAPRAQPPPAAPASAPAGSPARDRPPLVPAQPIRPVALPPGPHSPLQRLLQQHQQRQSAALQDALPTQQAMAQQAAGRFVHAPAEQFRRA